MKHWGRVEIQTHTPPGNAVCQRSIPMVHGVTLIPIQPGRCVSACLTTVCVHMRLNMTAMVSISYLYIFYIFGVL